MPLSSIIKYPGEAQSSRPEELYGMIPSLDDFLSFGCRGYALISVHGKALKRRSEQVMYMRKGFGKIGRACFYHPPLPIPSVLVIM